MTTLILAMATATHMFSLPTGLLSAVCYVESSHRAEAVHLDDGGQNSIGLCQLHLSTAKMLGFKGTQKMLMNPNINAFYAAKYLKYQLKRYNGDMRLAISAYNSGTVRYEANGSVKNPKYVAKVFKAWAERR